MKRASPKKPPATPRKPIANPGPVIDPTHVAELAVKVMAGETIQAGSVDEMCALLELLKQRGIVLRKRTDSEVNRAPFSFIVEEAHAAAAAL